MIKLISDNTNGELEEKGGKIVCDPTLWTSVFVSLFGGNKEALTQTKRNPKGVENLDYFGNLYQRNGLLFNSEFEKITASGPFTSGNIKRFEAAVINDTAWLVASGRCDKIECLITILTVNSLRIILQITVNKVKYERTMLYEVEA